MAKFSRFGRIPEDSPHFGKSSKGSGLPGDNPYGKRSVYARTAAAGGKVTEGTSKGDQHKALAEKALKNDNPIEAHRHLMLAREHYRAEGQHTRASQIDGERQNIARESGIDNKTMAAHIQEARRATRTPQGGGSDLASAHAKAGTPGSSDANYHRGRADDHEARGVALEKAGQQQAADLHHDAAAAHRAAAHAIHNKNDSDEDSNHYKHLAREADKATQKAVGGQSPAAVLKQGQGGAPAISHKHMAERHRELARNRAGPLADAHNAAADAHAVAHVAQLSGDKQRYEGAKEKAAAATDKARQMETGPRGGQFTRTASGGKRYGKRGGGGAVASMRTKIPEDTQ